MIQPQQTLTAPTSRAASSHSGFPTVASRDSISTSPGASQISSGSSNRPPVTTTSSTPGTSHVSSQPSDILSASTTAPPDSTALKAPSTLQLPGPAISPKEYSRKGGPRQLRAVDRDEHHKEQITQSKYYHPLKGSNNIRILRIKQGNEEEEVICQLEHYDLDQAPGYEALSYCWGESQERKEITVNGLRGFKLTSHLWDALQRLRLPDHDRFLWIDAICIHQDNIQEKNHQILLMRRIYQRAYRTVIWIGNLLDGTTCERVHLSDDDSEDALATLCALEGLSAREHRGVSQELGRTLQSLQEHVETEDLGYVWWKRLWCIQEFHFSQRTPSVYIGPHAINWTHFNTLFDEDHDPLYLFHGLRVEEQRNLFDLLSMSGSFRCGDPRDRIYSLLGMTHGAANAIEPNYAHSILRIVEDSCQYLIHESKSLNVLVDGRVDRALWGRQKLKGAMPTWIPDLTSLPALSTVRGCNKYFTGRGTPQVTLVESEPAHSVSGSADIEYDRPRALSVRAVYFDKIVNRECTDVLGYFPNFGETEMLRCSVVT